MTLAAARRVPGVRFETVPPELDSTLPRMDIAAFVGLASSGPVDLPVVVEDAERFREVFGADLPLAIDATTGRMATAHLGQSVEAFFANGGRRCWVVRVAGEATTNRFPIPGVVSSTDRDDPAAWRLASTAARSPGSWSDGIRCGARTLRRRILRAADVTAFDPTEGAFMVALRAAAPTAGDRVDVTFSNGTVLHTTVADVANDAATGQPIVSWDGLEALWTRRPAGPVDTIATRMASIDTEGQTELDDPALTITAAGEVVATTSLALDAVPGPGSTLLVTVGADTYIGTVASAPVATATVTTLTLFPFIQVLDAAPNPVGTVTGVDEVGIEIASWLDDGIVGTSGALGTDVGAPHWWGHLPTDLELFSRELFGTLQAINRSTRRRLGPLDDRVLDPRFDLAAPADAPSAVYPLGLLTAHDASRTAGPIPASGDRLARDGIAEFGPQLFVDDDLVDHGSRSIMAEGRRRLRVDARMERLLDDGDQAGVEERLRGFHGVLPIDEVTMLAVPDAVLPGWSQVPVEPPAALAPPTAAIAGDGTAVEWTHPGEVTGFEVQASLDHTFTDTGHTWTTDATTRSHVLDGLLHGRYFIRVRAFDNDVLSPWSNTVDLRNPPTRFEACNDPVPPAPHATLVDSTEVTWCVLDDAGVCVATDDPAVAGAVYTLEAADDPGFIGARPLASGSATSHPVAVPEIGIVYLRVRMQLPGGPPSPWSNTVAVAADATLVWRMDPVDGVDSCAVALQQAVLRFCAARADILALLSMSNQYRPDDIGEHLHVLRTQAAPFRPEAPAGCDPTGPIADRHQLTFGAVHHPWISTRRNTDTGFELAPIPPVGAVAGAMATRAIERGAWIAPANLGLVGGIGLDPTSVDSAFLRATVVNPLTADRAVIRIDGADTLAHTEVMRPISVRRLIMLIRRIALHDGTRYVFEPNGDDFRRLVVTHFETILGDLYRRGAFAGRTPDEAFRVVVHQALNNQAAIDNGRFIVDILVAPSVPLEFITVRLLQVATGGVTVEEVA